MLILARARALSPTLDHNSPLRPWEMRSEATNLIVLDGLHEEELGMDVSRWAGGLALVKDEVGEKHDRPAGRSNTCQHWAPGYPRFPNLGLQAQAAAA